MTYRLNSVLKIPVANVYRKLISGMAGVWPPEVSFQLCMVCGSNFWIKFKSISETVYETFNFSL